MIIMRMMGGLGNQMFQYALGRSLSLRHNVTFKMDLAPLQADPMRSYGLNCFNIDTPAASPEEVAHLRGLDGGRLTIQLNRLNEKLKPFSYRREVYERTCGFDPGVLKIRHGAYFIGYWQDERYFHEIETDLRQDFEFRSSPNTANSTILTQIRAKQSVCLHVRRTDYVTDPKIATKMAVCALNYYRDAVDTILSRLSDPHFFIFSDDPAWARNNIKFNFQATYVNHNSGVRDFEDLRLMSACKHSIIANSSFSWWSAWLGDHPDKIIIAPRNWFIDKRANALRQVPEHWIQL